MFDPHRHIGFRFTLTDIALPLRFMTGGDGGCYSYDFQFLFAHFVIDVCEGHDE